MTVLNADAGNGILFVNTPSSVNYITGGSATSGGRPYWGAAGSGNVGLELRTQSAGNVIITNSVAATTSATGSLVLSGGLGVAGAIYAGSVIYTSSVSFILGSKATITGGTGSSTAAFGASNSPVAGNPTKWLPYDDNGTTRYIPAW